MGVHASSNGLQRQPARDKKTLHGSTHNVESEEEQPSLENDGLHQAASSTGEGNGALVMHSVLGAVGSESFLSRRLPDARNTLPDTPACCSW